MNTFIDILINQVLGQAPFIMGIICFIGYICLGKGFSRAITGFIKAFVGFNILQVGTGGLTKTFSPILKALQSRFGVEGAVMDSYVPLGNALDKLGENAALVGYTLLIGFAWNILLVLFSKYTKIRALQVTGHVMYVQSTILLWMVYYNLGSVSWVNVVIAGILVGTYWSVFANLTLDITNQVTGNANFAIGHQQMLALWLSSKLAKKFGKTDTRIEDLTFPKTLEMFNDNIVSSTILMTIFFGMIMVIIGSEAFKTKLVFPLFIFTTTAKFAVYLSIILYGVRMFSAELVESFNGISAKILPGSAPAVDIATIYGFGHPNATLLGFVAGAVGQIVGLILLFLTGSPVVLIPGFIPMFFDNAGIAVYANYFGGVRAAAILPFLSGVIQVSLGAITYMLSGLSGGIMANFDWVTLVPGFMLIMRYGQIIGVVILILVLLAIPQIQYKKNKESYI
ncbi:PTS ascorbate transporter subunit IIC [Aerococcus christensenii]|uniref:Ascorbate-specific PTS system EIIC component n=1 Tax=Aerococcus christensenii TaxID=87541 RepID=A0A2I1K676_9LACT|nr:PTS ascorbate transporter subunit IIC [Aerococcus christensenii]PKY91035.1 PTS ascorbate transporter subunit IIC [Aerococcus christensenii]